MKSMIWKKNVFLRIFTVVLMFVGARSHANTLMITQTHVSHHENSKCRAVKKMNTPILCFERMAIEYFADPRSYDAFSLKWAGLGGRRRQVNGRDFANINPCPQFFHDVVLFVPYGAPIGGTLEFHMRPDAHLTLADLEATFGGHSKRLNDPNPGAEYFTLTINEPDAVGSIIADFERKVPLRTDKPYKLTLRLSEKSDGPAD